jgi:uncharacterized membrane protein YbhN (UPF0104 family)
MPVTSETRRYARRDRLPRRTVRLVVGLALLGATTLYLIQVTDGSALASTASAVVADPVGLSLALACYATAFLLRAWAWRRALPGLPLGQSWAALHVSLLGNHVLPLRLGEPLRVTSVLRRTPLALRPVVASAVTLRAADLAAVVSLAVVIAPAVAVNLVGQWLWPMGAALVGLTIGGAIWSARLRRAGETMKPLPIVALGATVLAWALEAAVIWQIARQAGHALTLTEAVAVTAVTIAAQSLAVTPGGFGSYEAAATAALVVLGVPASPAFAIALTTHAIKTVYALAAGAIAVVAPAPSYLGRLRLPRACPARPAAKPVAADRPVVAFIPVHNEQATVGSVVGRLPRCVAGRPLVTVVVDDGSTDQSAAIAADAGAHVITQPANLGLGAAVRRGLAAATAYEPAAVVYLDADGEYFSEDIDTVAGPVLAGTADYVVGSRFIGRIERMLPHRRLGNRVLTAWMRWLTRQPITDGQSGYRSFSPAAADAAEVIHDYNYAQVLTLDLLAKGFVYAEVPIRYSFRESGTSFVRLGRYLRKVIPAVYRELNAPAPDSSPAAPLTNGTLASR